MYKILITHLHITLVASFLKINIIYTYARRIIPWC